MSGEIGILVQARMSSQRLPGKALLKIGNRPLIFYVIERLKLIGLPLMICTSTHPSDDPLVEYLRSQNYTFFRDSLDNVLHRYIAASEKFNIEKIIRITGDNPFIDTSRLLKALPLFNKYDYVDGIYLGEGLIKGTGFEFVSLNALKQIKTDRIEHLEHVTSWLRENSIEAVSKFQLPRDAINFYRNDVFLTCDYPEDLELLKAIFSNFNYRWDVPISEIVSFLENKPHLKQLNCQLH